MQTLTPRQYLEVDIANSFGLDKKSWNERLEWFEANKHDLLARLQEAETPAMYYAGVKAWERMQAGRPVGYPISLDATASGMQILSCLTGDEQAARLTNVLDTGRRMDAYTELYESMLRRVGGTMQFARKDLKRAIMTAFYGSEKVPKTVFGEGRMLGAFLETLEEETPYIWELNKAFLAMWDPTAFEYSWVMPDNFHVHVKVMTQIQEDVQFLGEKHATFRSENLPSESGRSIGANVTHSIDGMIVRELVRRCDFSRERVEEIQQLICNGPCGKNPSEQTAKVRELWELYERSGYLSARILDHLDSTNIGIVDTDPLQDLLDSLPKKPFKLLAVHDCFRVHPNYGDDLRRQYNLQLSLVAQSDLLRYLLQQVLHRSVNIRKQCAANFPERILDADYALS